MASEQTKPSIVFAHGIWADGSRFSKVATALDWHDSAAGEYACDIANQLIRVDLYRKGELL